MDLVNFSKLCNIAKLRLIKMHYDSKVGHIGGNLSCIDILMVLHHLILKPEDVFILSKGHSVGALYITCWSLGDLSEEELYTFHGENTYLAGHPIAHSLKHIRFSTGSLGHGLGLAAGIAVSRKLSGQKGRIFCLTSDGDWQEGSTWESLNFIVSKNLDNISILVDQNGLQGIGKVEDIMKIPPLEDRLSCYNLNLVKCDGHNLADIQRELQLLTTSILPNVIIFKTVKGKGVAFMENKVEWHYLPLSDEQYLTACRELNEK